jgi:hypothetical protein
VKTKRKAKPKGKPPAKRRPARAAVRAKPAPKAKAKAKAKAAPKAKAKPAKPVAIDVGKWLGFVQEHGVVLASARGAVPNLAEAVAGEPIVGSWWAHPKGNTIFAVLSALDDHSDVHCFKLIDRKVTFVHKRLWPALVRLAQDGVLPADRVARLRQEHTPTGHHRNIVTPFPDWVDRGTSRVAEAITPAEALAQLGVLWIS